MLAYNRLPQACCTIALLLLVSCGEDERSNDMNEHTDSDLLTELSSNDQELNLSQQLPLEFELSNADRLEYRSTLNGIYQELTTDEQAVGSSPAADPTESCDRCGRETGFLPALEISIEQFLHVEMKALTFGLVSWSIDQDELANAIEDILGSESPETLAMSYRLTLVRVDMTEISEEMAMLATNGELLANESSDAISVSRVVTTSEEMGLTLDHGFSYLLFVNATETNTKLSSLASAPVLIHCFEGAQDQDNGGCVQITNL